MIKKYFLFFALFFFFTFMEGLKGASFAQNKNIDSMQTLLKTDKPDTNKVNHSYTLCEEYINIGLYDTALHYGNSALQLAKQLNFKKGIAGSYSNIGIVYYYQSDYPKTFEYWLKALKLYEELKDKNGIARQLDNIGGVYFSQGDYPKALDYFSKALKIHEERVDKSGIANSLGNIGIAYFNQANYPKALDYFFKALKIKEELGEKNRIAIHLSYIGAVYAKQGNYSKALDYLFMALKINEELGATVEIAGNLSSIGSVYTSTGKFKEGEQYFKRAITIDDSIGAMDGLRTSEEELSQLYDTTGQFKLALFHLKKAIAIKDTLFSQENKKQLVRKEMNYEFDKKEAITKAENEKQKAIAEEKSRKQSIIIWSVAGGLLLVLLFTGFIFRSLRITRKQKNIIELQKNEVFHQKEIADSQRIIAVELREIAEKQKEMVEDKQKEIVDSITYASRIQRALLTSEEYIKNNLEAEHFILFKPKDIVSGDFYWAHRSKDGKGLFYIATADCTGHGVPGAFMSMLNISYLNENVIEQGLQLPNEILNAQRVEIIKALNPPGSTEVSKDGMDCILCAFDFERMLLHFAAANNPLWLVRNNELVEYKPDKMPVGKYTETVLPFTLQTIELQKGDIIYTSTDGFADQFGANGKKMMKKIFKEELIKIHQQPMSEQKKHLIQFFNNWKGNKEQVDDVCVIGIRV